MNTTKILTAVIILTTTIVSFAKDETLIVTANRLEQNIQDTLTDIAIIEREDIERLQPQSFTDLLVNIAGLDITQKGGPGQDASIFSRGTNPNQLLILIDGVSVGSATLGGKSVATIAVSQIERVEIVKGPRAALWGSDAIGGVIQIFTRRYQSGEHRLALTTGSNSTRDIDVSAGFGSENNTNTISYSHKETDGFDAHIDTQTDDDGHENDSLAIRGDYLLGTANTGTLDWVAQLDKGETEFDSTWGGNILAYNNYLWNIRYSQQLAGWNNQLSVSNSRDKSYSFGNGVEKVNADNFETRKQQYKFLTQNNISDALTIAGGLEWIKDDVSHSTTEYKNEKRSTKSVHINTNYNKDNLLAEFAIRYDDVENVASDTTFNLGVGYRFSEQHQLSLNIAEGFKAPSFNDLYYPWGGNEDLKFETSENIEIVYKTFFDQNQLVMTIYDSKVDNLIQWIPDNDDVWSPQNIGQAEISGVDASFTVYQGDLTHKLMLSHTNTKDAVTGVQLMLRAKKHFGYEITYSGDSVSVFSQIQYVGKRPDTDFLTYMPTMLDGYVQTNIGINYSFKENWQLNLKINDAFDKAATLVSGYNAAGRELYLTLVHMN
ncbi:MAG: TonB-dependent receptor [Gammaproteobacteria bacterium]|nr:TonB-dependent receptor [Gammaproteobacteria bacterium]